MFIILLFELLSVDPVYSPVWRNEKKKKKDEKSPCESNVPLGMISFWPYLFRVCIFILDSGHPPKQ